MKKMVTKTSFIALTLSFACYCYAADYAIIVHPSNNADMNQQDIARLFLGKIKKFSNGEQAIPVNNSAGAPVRQAFESSIAGKTESQMKAYWSTLVFTGKGEMPKEVNSDSEMMDLVRKNPSVIGYVDKSSVDDSVKVVLTFE